MKCCANRPLARILILAAILFVALNGPVQAAETGWSSYTPGTFGDFSMNYAQPGLYFRDYLFYIASELEDYPVMPAVNADMEQSTWVNLLTITYISEKKFLGGNYFCNFAIPYGLSSEIDVDVLTLSLEDSSSGLGDIQVVPFGLMWHSGYFHFTLSENVVLKSGEYNADNLANIGRNYNSYETLFGMTWLHEKGGHEISFLAGYMLNEKNQATDYRTGDEFHIDATIAQYFSESFGIGVIGYYYHQVTDDESPTLDAINEGNRASGLETPDGYKSESLGVGPAIMWSPAKDLQIIAKWINEVDAENRFQGDWGFISACIKF
jgi:hypothetical protein